MAKSELNKEFAVEVTKADLAAFEKDGFECISEAPILTLEIGEGIKGRYIEKGEYNVFDKQSQANKTLPCYLIETEKGEIRLGGKVTLDKGMNRAKPGDTVMVVRGSDDKTSSGNRLPVYKVFVKRGV